MDSERRFLQHLIDAHSNDDTSTGQTKLRRRQKRVVAAQYVDEQIKETYLSGLLFRHLYQNFSKIQTKEEISTGKFPHQLVIQIIEHCIQEADIEERDPEILLKNCLCILPSVSEKISDSLDQQNRPESYRKYFLESWKGSKRTNEDYFNVSQSDQMEIYAIFDGHGGFSAAEFASCLLVPQVQNQLVSSHGEDQIINTFGNVQKMIEYSISDRSGSTAALYIETRGKSIFSWVGDSSILGIDEVSEQAELLTEPHTLECSEMRESISKNGAVITGSKGNYRVNGELGVARALGKSGPRPAISAKPSVREFSSSVIKDRYKWICLVTDGVTDVLSLKQIAGLVQGKPESPSINVLKSALAAGAADNLSCIVVEIRGD